MGGPYGGGGSYGGAGNYGKGGGGYGSPQGGHGKGYGGPPRDNYGGGKGGVGAPMSPEDARLNSEITRMPKGQGPQGLLRLLSQAGDLRKANPVVLAGALHRLSKMGFQARGRLDPVFKGLLDSTEAQLSNADQWSSRHLVNAAYAVAKLRVTPQDTRAYNAFAQASSQRLQHFNAQDISNLSP